MENKKTVKLDETEYTVTPIPIAYNPYFKQITRLLGLTADTIEEAVKSHEILDNAVTMILGATVQPNVLPEHRNYLYNLVATYTGIVMNEAVKQAELFRNKPKPTNEKGS